jgi:pimeloyl-ACP methyl ester carboxylesterase
LGVLKTWIRIEPLIQAVEQRAIATLNQYPETPMRIIGHSMGGLIWLEVLHRHPEWWKQVESLALVGSPVGGADLARVMDPWGWGIGMARDLGLNRRSLAEAIASQIPTLVIAGDVDNGSDGTIPVESTKVFGAKFVCLPAISHPKLKNHHAVAETIQQFWTDPQQFSSPPTPNFAQALIRQLQQVTGMTDAHRRGFEQSRIYCTFANGLSIRTWKNPLGIDHIFLACPQGNCLYSGFVGWQDAKALQQILAEIASST